MLADEIREFETGMRYPDGYAHDRAVDGVRGRLERAQVFVMDRQAISMAASVCLAKPSSTLSAVPLVRLPFPLTWIEFANADLKAAMADLGSPNLPVPAGVVTIVRSGFLLSQTEDGTLEFEYVHADRTGDGRVLCDLCPVRGTFSTAPGKGVSDPRPIDARAAGATGRVRRQSDLISTDPEEARADADLHDRFRWEPHPDMNRVRANLEDMMGAARVAGIEVDQSGEMERLFFLQVLPALILLACRNAVDVEVVPAPERLNRQRARKGRAPLVEHRVVRMHLSPKERRMAATGGGGGSRSTRGTVVMGHFKVRKSGIYWWSPHARSGRAEGEVRRTFVLTK